MNKKYLVLPAFIVTGLVSVGCTSYQIVPTNSLTNTDNTTNTEVNTQANPNTNTPESVQTQNNTVDNSQNTASGKITQEQAKEIALKHANLNANDVVFIC